ncbi:MAG: HPr-rel-A system PqqD family peptide chaperone [Sphingomonadales bacterium]
MFRAADPATLLRVSLDGMTAIYDRRSGQTHLIADPVPEILDVIGENAVDAATIAARLGAEDAVDLVAGRVDELLAIGLVEAA